VGDHTLGWSGQAENVRVELFDVFEHPDLLREPDVRTIACRLDELMEEVQNSLHSEPSRRVATPGTEARRGPFTSIEEIG
jgi:hypothetical protein